MTLEDLLRIKVIKEIRNGKNLEVTPEFRVKVQVMSDDFVHFSIQANGYENESGTLDFVVTGNELRPIRHFVPGRTG